MSRSARLWRSTVELFDRREQATALACVRICVGLILIYSMVSAAWAGLVSTLWVDIEHGGFMPIRGFWALRWLGGATPAVIYTLFTTVLVCAALLVVGLFTRVAALIALFAYASLVSTHGDTSGGADLMTTNALWILALSGAGRTLSLSARLRTGSFVCRDEVPAWPRHVLIFQIVLVYFAAGLNKTGFAWTPMGGYTALHYVLQDPTFVRFSSDAFMWLSPLTRLATAVTWHWEQLTVLLLVYFYCANTRERGGRLRRWVLRFDWRKPWVVIGVGLHLGIFLSLNVGAFSFIALSYYFALFAPAELEASWERLRARFRAIVRR